MNAINWRLVFRHVLPAVYIPAATMIAFSIVVALTGAGRYEHIEAVGFLVAGSSLVLVFARLAAKEFRTAAANVFALAAGCFMFVGVTAALRGAWRYPDFWLGLLLLAVLFATAALIGLRWARRWERWRHNKPPAHPRLGA